MKSIIIVEDRLRVIKEILNVIVEHDCFFIEDIFIYTPSISWSINTDFRPEMLCLDFRNEINKKTLSIIKNLIIDISLLYEKHNNSRNEIIIDKDVFAVILDDSLYNYTIEYSNELGYTEIKLFRERNKITEKYKSYEWIPIKERDKNKEQDPYNTLKSEFKYWTKLQFVFLDYINKLNSFIDERVECNETNTENKRLKAICIKRLYSEDPENNQSIDTPEFNKNDNANPAIFDDEFIISIHREFNNYLWKSVDIDTCKDWFRVNPRGEITLESGITKTAFCYFIGKIEGKIKKKPKMGEWMSFHIGKNNYSKLKKAWEAKDKQGNIIVCYPNIVKEEIDRRLINTVQL